MGLNVNGTKFLLFARRLGVSFEKTATIGRQELLVSPATLRQNLRLFDIELSVADTEKLFADANNFAEPFLKLLGAAEVVSFDASDYENASIRHDFNQPIPNEFKGKFTTVLDGGTLEHIFNFPTAIRNCMEMVAEGGHFLAITPANNHLGHGFYQFSPELFFRVVSAQNGFELEKLIIFEESSGCPWFEVADPDFVKERVTLINGVSTMMLIIARKIATVDIFAVAPQQSDYVSVWAGNAVSSQNATRPRRSPLSVIRRIRMYLDRHFGMLNRRTKHFKKIDPA